MARTKRTNTELAAEIGKVIREQRKAAGMTQAALAEMIGLESETVSRMENGVRLPSIEKLVEIAESFDVPVAVFFEHVGVLRKPDSLLVEKIGMALEKLPQAGQHFVLEVAQNYAHYHLVKPRPGRKKAG
jgi:transcriptional regulator with XRE-family HTH domain